jgi:hypothetical protein
VMNIQRSVQRSATMLGAGGDCWPPIIKARVIRDGNDGSIITKVEWAGFEE